MKLELLQQRFQIGIIQSVWTDFFNQFTIDNRDRLITIKILDCQLGNFDILKASPLHSVTYNPADQGNNLVVTVSRQLGVQETTYDHVIGCPQTVEIITDADGIVQSCCVTDDEQVQTIIYLGS